MSDDENICSSRDGGMIIAAPFFKRGNYLFIYKY
jgi:hypothetical protein